MDENRLLLATIEDKYRRFQRGGYLLSTDFLTEAQQIQAQGTEAAKDRRAFFYGGYDDAERQVLLFVPEYIAADDAAQLQAWFVENPAQCPLQLLSLTYRIGVGAKRLTHRDFLGALLAEGIRREKVGDILVGETETQIVVSAELAAYLAQHFTRVGRTVVDAKVLPISRIKAAISTREEVKLIVASPRLDHIVASGFGVSRKAATAAINQGLVMVGGVQVLKPDKQLSGGEKVTLRGKGKVIYRGVTGTSKKGKCYIVVEQYR